MGGHINFSERWKYKRFHRCTRGRWEWEQDRFCKEWRERVLAEVTEMWGYLCGKVEMYSWESMRVTIGKSPS